ncbi:hypothetical protein T4E_5421 [Trichinella pseudospiralis]|uniref:Uncharacterized protein n=1 Tax=Trichinella pseudospiralis TaxID=6337 RepID=A0A0V0XZC8_TRIPS|nr:hypothetical protein T4E_5421 [Trichinella pseudospiralis]
MDRPSDQSRRPPPLATHSQTLVAHFSNPIGSTSKWLKRQLVIFVTRLTISLFDQLSNQKCNLKNFSSQLKN